MQAHGEVTGEPKAQAIARTAVRDTGSANPTAAEEVRGERDPSKAGS